MGCCDKVCDNRVMHLGEEKEKRKKGLCKEKVNVLSCFIELKGIYRVI